jgi:hypothetical protein
MHRWQLDLGRGLRMKTYFILACLVLYCFTFTLVTYLLSIQKFERWEISLMTHVPLLVFSGIIYVSEYWGFNSIHDKRLQQISKICIFTFLLGYCLNSYGLVSGMTGKLFWFYGINLVGLSMILISSYRHGNFKN